MEEIIGTNCVFNNDTVRNKLAAGLVNYILYHNEHIRSRYGQRSYLPDYCDNLEYDPFPVAEYITFDDKMNNTPATQAKNKNGKKFISVSTSIKKWLGYICSRVAFEADQVYEELKNKISNGSTNTNDLDNVMFSKKLEFNLFKLIAKIVANNDYLLRNFMKVQLLETDIANKIKEKYDLSHALRLYNKNIADWLGKLLDDFFKLIGVHISLKNWFDRDATVNEKNLPPVLWLLAENTEFSESLYDFLSYIAPSTKENKAITQSDVLDLDFGNLSEEVKNISIDTKKGRGKKVDANKIAAVSAASAATAAPIVPELYTPSIDTNSTVQVVPAAVAAAQHQVQTIINNPHSSLTNALSSVTSGIGNDFIFNFTN